MLTSLRVKNLALVEDIRVDFGHGLNIVSGETGAGKSILIGALGLLLGERADKSLIRSGADQAAVEALFELSDPDPIQAALDELGLDAMEDGQLIVRRAIRQGGASQAWVNDQPVTLNALQQIGARLVDMHGPHDHQSLLHTAIQRDILDAFGHCFKARDQYEKQYAVVRGIEQRQAALNTDDAQVTAQIELLSHKVKELTEAELSEQEETELVADHDLLGNAQQILAHAQMVTAGLTEEEGCAVDTLASVLRALDALAKLMPEAAAWRTDVDEASRLLRAVAESIAERVDQIDADPARLAWLDERLTTYQRMKRKYGPTIHDALVQLDNARERLADLEQREERLATLDQERQTALQELVKRGRTLSTQRREAAEQLAAAITAELEALGFARGRFQVALETGEPNANGLDEVEFQFEPNLGEGLRPLRQIASSGEISRVMLATKAVLASHDQIPILVFDEIDANIGGETGEAVGRKLAAVAAHHQILCITHLPQVAMHGTRQYAVRKEVVNERTHTTVEPLDKSGRVEEIARMLGGRTLTELTISHAREMLQKVHGSDRD